MAESLIALVDEGDPSPTAKSVAELAGVSVRLIFHHFEDMDRLYEMAVRVQDDQHWSQLREVPADLPLDQRVDRTVQQRATLFEVVGSLRQSVLPLVSRDADIAGVVARQEQQLRRLLESTFAPELGRTARAKRELLDALDAATSWEAWDRLRRSQHLATAAARRVMARTMAGLLAR